MNCENKIYKPSGNDVQSEYMKKYAGEYVLIKDFETTKEQIVEHNKDMKEILKLAKKYTKDEVMVKYIPPSGIIFF